MHINSYEALALLHRLPHILFQGPPNSKKRDMHGKSEAGELMSTSLDFKSHYAQRTILVLLHLFCLKSIPPFRVQEMETKIT